MKIVKVTVRSAQVFQHPSESYSNLQTSIELTAELQDGEDAIECARDLQVECDALAEGHRQQLLTTHAVTSRLNIHREERDDEAPF